MVSVRLATLIASLDVAMYRKSWPQRHPVLSAAGMLLALATVVAFWRLFLVLAILSAIGGGALYLVRRARPRKPATDTGAESGWQPTLSMEHGSIVIGPRSGRAPAISTLDRHDRYVRQASDYRRPPCPLMLDGSSSWSASTGWDNPDILDRLPAGADIVVEAVPEPGNPYDHTAVALDLQGMRVGYLYRSFSHSLCPAIIEANKAGFYVVMRAKLWRTDTGRKLEVRAALAADLKKWLSLPPDVRGTEFFEFNWTRTDYRNFYQDRLSTLLDSDDSRIVDCDFNCGPRNTEPYNYVPGPVGAPAHPKPGTYADIFAAGIHIGELRTYSKLHPPDVVGRIQSGQKTGLARLERWPDNIELQVCVPNADGSLPRFSGPFLWRQERQEAKLARLRKVWAAADAEVVDGVGIGSCRQTLADLKRAGDLISAWKLAMRMVDAAERGSAIGERAPHSWVTLEAAIILRKLKDTRGEIEVLERYLAHCPPGEADAKVVERLEKLRIRTLKTGEQA